MADRTPLLRAENVVKHFPAGLGASVKAVENVSLEIYPGETVGLVGESGCGKSTLGRLITQLLPVTSGNIFFDGVDLTKLRGEKLRQYRRQLQMIFQDPYSSLDPRMTVGDIIAEPLENFGLLRGRAKDQRVQELLKIVGLNPYFNNRYPHEFSGGQRQRIGIARALALRPKLIVADEPISALDVSIQAQIMNLLKKLQDELGVGYLLVAHNLATVRYLAHHVGVMYLGKIVEEAPTEELYTNPLHPYTRSLFSAALPAHPDVKREEIILRGEVPSPINPPSGCRFHPRCPAAMDVCSVEAPLERKMASGHRVACHLYS